MNIRDEVAFHYPLRYQRRLTGRELQAKVEARDAAMIDALSPPEYDEELELGDLDVWVRAESIAHDAAEIESLQSDGVICLADIKVKVAGQWIGADRAMYQVALHHMAGRYEQADCVARDTVTEIAKALEPLVRSGRVKWEA
jgi:hypothetical protein